MDGERGGADVGLARLCVACRLEGEIFDVVKYPEYLAADCYTE